VNYNMYDTRSVGKRDDWKHDPFGATLEPRGDFPRVLYGRGAHVPKGPDMAWLGALSAIRAVTGTLPVNIAFLAEGDEILGSQSYAGLIDRYSERLRTADACVYLRAAQNAAGELPLILGYKTFITFELKASGKAWGRGPANDAAHSATRVIVDSPALRLVQVLDTLYTKHGDIAVDGWKQALQPPAMPRADVKLVEGLRERYRGKSWADVIPGLGGTGVSRFTGDPADDEVLIRYMYGSSLNLQGLRAGYTGPGTRTYTIPEVAVARLDARLVTDTSPRDLVAALRNHLDRRGFSDVEIDVLSAYPGSRTPEDAPIVSSEKAGGQITTWPMQGYGGPWSIFARDFGIPLVFASGIGHGGGVGLPDEFLVIDGGGKVAGLREMQRFCVDLVLDFAETASVGDRLKGAQA
jgi:acetylornithine deacetylase/succinyl-diaminopimelate desuccinylase-like protein